MLAAPIRLLVTLRPEDPPTELTPTGAPNITRLGSGTVRWETHSELRHWDTHWAGVVRLHLVATLSYDGFVDVKMNLTTSAPQDHHGGSSGGAAFNMSDVRMQIPMREEVVKWLMGW